MTLTVFSSYYCIFLIFQFCIFELPSLKMLLICSYFLTNFSLVVLIKKCILSMLLQGEILEIATRNQKLLSVNKHEAGDYFLQLSLYVKQFALGTNGLKPSQTYEVFNLQTLHHRNPANIEPLSQNTTHKKIENSQFIEENVNSLEEKYFSQFRKVFLRRFQVRTFNSLTIHSIKLNVAASLFPNAVYKSESSNVEGTHT